MQTPELGHPSIQAAFAALQAGDKAAWFAQFSPDSELLDDGQPLAFRSFFENAIGHERFVSIDAVSADGHEVTGTIETEQWGSFKAYFRFSLNAEGKIHKLEIGRAD